jgi:RecA-family ATPase
MSYILETVFSDLLNAEIDESQNLLGNRWLERGTFAMMIGSSGVGKSVAAIQGGILAAAGLPFFGIKPAHPLRVLIVQSEDSRNDRIDQVQCARVLVSTEKHTQTDKNLFIYTTTDERGEILFNRLENISLNPITKKPEIDFYILNPAFAFFPEDASVESSSDVNFFLRSLLQPFLIRMEGAALLVHHTPKLTNRDTSKWSAQTFMYSGHGSAEWTNAARAVITIDGTNDPKVFEFRIAKRGYHSGWTPNENGVFLRHYSHAPKVAPMHWIPSSEEDVAAARQESGLKDKDVLELFSDSDPEFDRTSIVTKLRLNGLIFDNDEIDKILTRLVKNDRLRENGVKFVLSKKVKAEERAAQAEKRSADRIEREVQEKAEVFKRIKDSMPNGIVKGDLTSKDAFMTFGWRIVERCLIELESQARIRVKVTEKGTVKTYRYFTI